MNFFYTHISDKAVEYTNELLKSSFLSEGPRVKEFERLLAKNLAVINPVAVNSGTTALHLALVLAGVGPGDEVILPAQTFVATGLVVLMQQAIPVFADIQYETGNICPNSILDKITKKTKAIIPVHWAGYPSDLDEINQIANTYGLAVIEDAAHSLGATYKGKPIGSISRFTAFSFQAIKHLTTGDGGALCCLQEDDFNNSKKRRWFGIDRANSKPSILGEREYDIDQVGYKYHMNDLAATVGIGNLEEFPKILRRIRDIAKIYTDELNNISGLNLLKHNLDRESSFWLFTVLVENRTNFITRLKEASVPSSVVHLRIDRNSIFGGLTPNLLNQEKFNDRQVSLPIHAGLTDADVRLIIKTIKNGW